MPRFVAAARYRIHSVCLSARVHEGVTDRAAKVTQKVKKTVFVVADGDPTLSYVARGHSAAPGVSERYTRYDRRRDRV